MGRGTPCRVGADDPPPWGEGDHAKHGGGAREVFPALSTSRDSARAPPPPYRGSPSPCRGGPAEPTRPVFVYVTDRKSVVEGKSVSIPVDLRGSRVLKKKQSNNV